MPFRQQRIEGDFQCKKCIRIEAKPPISSSKPRFRPDFGCLFYLNSAGKSLFKNCAECYIAGKQCEFDWSEGNDIPRDVISNMALDKWRKASLSAHALTECLYPRRHTAAEEEEEGSWRGDVDGMEGLEGMDGDEDEDKRTETASGVAESASRRHRRISEGRAERGHEGRSEGEEDGGTVSESQSTAKAGHSRTKRVRTVPARGDVRAWSKDVGLSGHARSRTPEEERTRSSLVNSLEGEIAASGEGGFGGFGDAGDRDTSDEALLRSGPREGESLGTSTAADALLAMSGAPGGPTAVAEENGNGHGPNTASALPYSSRPNMIVDDERSSLVSSPSTTLDPSCAPSSTLKPSLSPSRPHSPPEYEVAAAPSSPTELGKAVTPVRRRHEADVMSETSVAPAVPVEPVTSEKAHSSADATAETSASTIDAFRLSNPERCSAWEALDMHLADPDRPLPKYRRKLEEFEAAICDMQEQVSRLDNMLNPFAWRRPARGSLEDIRAIKGRLLSQRDALARHYHRMRKYRDKREMDRTIGNPLLEIQGWLLDLEELLDDLVNA